MEKFVYTAAEARNAFNNFKTKRNTIKQMNLLLKRIQKDAESGMSKAVYYFDSEGFTLYVVEELLSLGYQVHFRFTNTRYRIEVHW
jgi:hypothetical protein